MEPYKINFWNAMILITMGLWSFYDSETVALSLLVLPIMGLIFFLATPGFKNGNQKVIHAIVMLTLLTTLFLFVPLLRQTDGMILFRVSVMLVSGTFASIFFFQSFFEARKARKSES